MGKIAAPVPVSRRSTHHLYAAPGERQSFARAVINGTGGLLFAPLLIMILATSLAPVGLGNSVGASTPTTPTSQLSQAENNRLEEAVHVFEAHGLELPQISIRFHSHTDNCRGHLGRFDTRTRQIDICSELSFILFHELAHLWMSVNLTDSRREQFVSTRGLLSWNSSDHARTERGIEVAAFAIQQTLMNYLGIDSERYQRFARDVNFLVQEHRCNKPDEPNLHPWHCPTAPEQTPQLQLLLATVGIS